MRTGDSLDALRNTHINKVFSQTTVSMEVNPWMELTFVEVKIHVNKLSWLKVSCINCCYFGGVVIFVAEQIVHGDWFILLGQCFW